MKSYYVFSDECGQYKRERSASFILSHPFYVRSTVIIDLDDYIKLEQAFNEKKSKYNIPIQQEIKWSHLGNLIKHNPPDYLKTYSLSYFQELIKDIVSSILDCPSIILFFSLTNNKVAKRVDEIKIVKMHLQNMLQRVQHDMEDKAAYATIIVDDLNSQSIILKKACFSMMQEGDFVSYKNIRKSILIDISEQCVGLQIADLCAGIFTASLKYIGFKEDKKFDYAFTLLTSIIYKKIRCFKPTPCNSQVYGFGIREVPDNAGKLIAQTVSIKIEELLNQDEYNEWFDFEKNL